jgi:hypothetical protein
VCDGPRPNGPQSGARRMVGSRISPDSVRSMGLASAFEIRRCSATDGGCTPPDDASLGTASDACPPDCGPWPDRRVASALSEGDRPVTDNHTAPARTALDYRFAQCSSRVLPPIGGPCLLSLFRAEGQAGDEIALQSEIDD